MHGTLLLLVAVVLLPLLIVQAGIYTVWYYTRWSEQELATLDTATEAAATFAAFVDDIHRQASAIGDAIVQLKPKFPDQVNVFLAAADESYPSVRSWSWIDPKGVILASSQSKMIGVNVGDRGYLQGLLRGRPWAVSDLLTDRLIGDRIIVVADRVEDRKGRLVGVVAAVADVKTLGERAVALQHTVGEAIALFDRHGVLVFNTQPKGGMFEDWRPDDPILTKAIAEGKPQIGVLRRAIGNGKPEAFIAARVPVRDIGWVAGARRPVSQAMAGVHAGLWIAGGLNFLVAVASALLAFSTSGGLIRQLRMLQLHAEAIGRGQPTRFAEDAGIHELAQLGAAFNRMGDSILRHTQQLEAANQRLQHEIADRERTAEQLMKSNEELEQFAYVASHDLQEPLRVVVGYVQLLDRRYKTRLDAGADEFLHYIVDGVSRMQQLIGDLLDYSRIGTRAKPFQTVDLRTVVDRALANLQRVVEENDAKVTCDPLPNVRGDESQLVQLFQNLIANGVKFHNERAPEIHISARREQDHWVFAVGDNGIGIERQYWERIFVIFQRLHTRRKYEGTGIGLAICKRIVERHGGRIWVESEPNQGTTFFFTIP